MRKAALSLFTVAIALSTLTTVRAEIPWQTDLRSAHTQAQSEGKMLLLHFYSDNCMWCDRLEEGSFKSPEVGEAVVKSFVPVKVHANKSPQLTEMFKVTKFPTDVIVTTKGKTLSHQVSPQQPARYVAMLTKVAPAPEAPRFAGAVPAPEAKVAAAQPNANIAAPEVALQSGIEAPSVGIEAAGDQTPPANSMGFSLPGNLSNGAKGQLASSPSESMSLAMPGQESVEATGAAITPPLPSATIAQETTAALDIPTAPLDTAAPSATSVADEPSGAPAAEMPELAMQGFCPVTVIKQDRWEDGNPQFGVIHLGKLYLFVSEDAMQTFLADPTPYTPVLNEIDVVRFFEEKKIVPGKREFGVKDPKYNRMFFFADEAARDHFESEYDRYVDASIKVMDQAVKDANPGS